MAWGELDVPLFGLGQDWYGNAADPQAAFCVAVDPRMLWFVASHGKAARLHPAARPGRFTPELWKHDVAELFLTDPTSGRYFEFNLSPNGAWWSCEFTAPRVRAEPVEIAFPEVATFAELAPNGGWVAAMAIPRDLLEALDELLGCISETRGSDATQAVLSAQSALTAARANFPTP
jgi:hypothetical protein